MSTQDLMLESLLAAVGLEAAAPTTVATALSETLPASPGAGTATANPARAGNSADIAYVNVSVRENLACRTVRIAVPTADAATTYTVDVIAGGVDYTLTIGPALATKAAIIAAIVSAVNTTPTLKDLVQATDETGSGTIGGWARLSGKTQADFAVALSVAGGTGTLAGQGDAASCSLQVFGYQARDGQGSYPAVQQGWYRVPLGIYGTDRPMPTSSVGTSTTLDPRQFHVGGVVTSSAILAYSDGFGVRLTGYSQVYAQVFNYVAPIGIGGGDTGISYGIAGTTAIGSTSDHSPVVQFSMGWSS